MEKVLSIIVDGLIFIAQVLLLIGFHELGHLLAGKLVKVPIDKFSIGFGPAIVKWKWGPTVYQISILPLGGYVKFKGEDFDDPDGFYAFPYWRKTVATLGGVVFNFILATVAYLAIGLGFGVAVPSPTLDIIEGSALAESGFTTGDSVVAVNGQEVTTYGELLAYASTADTLEMKVARPGMRLIVELPPLGEDESMNLPSSLELSEILDTTLISYGLEPGDKIKAVNDVKVSSAEELSDFFPAKDTLKVLVHRPENTLTLRSTGEELGLAQPLSGPIVGRVAARAPAEEAGLEPGDKLIEADGFPINHWMDLKEVEAHADTGKMMNITWIRGQDTMSAAIKPVIMRFLGESYVGIGLIPYTPYRPVTFGEALWLPLKRTGQVTGAIVVALGKLVRRPKELKGIISVARYTSQLRRWGFDFILGMFASLSITLAIINLLPIPALDGGRILMFSIEAIRRKRFGKKAWTIAVNIGFIVVLALIAWTLVSDIFFPS